MVKNPAAYAGDIRDTVQSLGPEGPLEDGMAPHSNILAWRISWTEKAWQAIVHGVRQSWTQPKSLSTHAYLTCKS